jgi:hypothetical protein
MNARPLKPIEFRDRLLRTMRVLVTLLLLSAIPAPGLPQAQEQTENAPQETAPAAPARRPKMPNVITFESSIGEVRFPHKAHIRMGCKKCHHQIQAGELATPHEDYLNYSQARCDVCHNEQENSAAYYGCANCHHSNLENIADETLSAKVVVHKSCWNCHLSGTGVEASERCSFCHEKTGTNAESATAGSAADTAGRAAAITVQ